MSKLGLHIHAWNKVIFDYCKNVGGAVHFILDPNEMYVNQVKAAQPKSLLFFRLWVPFQSLIDPIKDARRFTDLLLLYMDGCDFDGASGYNEWDGDLGYGRGGPEGLENWKRYADFEAERSRILHREGYLSAVGGCSVGTPPEEWFSEFRPALEEGDFLHLHEYSAPRMWDYSPWHCLKYRHVYKYLEEHGLPRLGLIISEAGVDGGVIQRPKEGWRVFGLPSVEHMDDWRWIDGKWMEDRYVVGGCAFDCGPTPQMGWQSFKMDPEMLDEFQRHVEAMGVTYWELEEENMEIPDWLTDLRDTLQRHPTKKYEQRPLDGIDTIVVHHTATIEATPEAIARWHVEHNDWPGAGYHIYIRKSGKAYLLNSLDMESYHCYKHNAHTIGLGFEGDFTKHSATEQQIEVGQKAVLWLYEVTDKILRVRGHKEMPDNQTACPGEFPVQELSPMEPEPEVDWRKRYEDLRNHTVAAINTLKAGLEGQ